MNKKALQQFITDVEEGKEIKEAGWINVNDTDLPKNLDLFEIEPKRIRISIHKLLPIHLLKTEEGDLFSDIQSALKVMESINIIRKNQSLQWIDKREIELKRELESLQETKRKKVKEQNEKDIQQIQLTEKYNSFVSCLKFPPEVYNTKRLNEKFGTTIQNHKHFQELQQKNADGNFSIDEFKLILKNKGVI